MKKVLILLLLATITFSSFTSAIFALGGDSNGGGSSGGGGHTGRDTVSKHKIIVPGSNVYSAGFRLTFIYAGADGTYYPVNVTRTKGKISKTVASMDFLINTGRSNNGYDTKFITTTKASKIEYLKNNSSTKTFDIVRDDIDNNYVSGINYINISNQSYLSNYYSSYIKKGARPNFDKCFKDTDTNSYCYGSTLLELFVGSDRSDKKVDGKDGDGWNQSLQTAILMGILPAGSDLDDLARISKDANGNSLKLLVEPLLLFRYGGNEYDRNATGYGRMTLMELMTIYLANNKHSGNLRKVRFYYTTSNKHDDEVKLEEDPDYKVRYMCVAPTRFYLDHPDEELRTAQYQGVGVSSYLAINGSNYICESVNKGSVATYKNSAASLMSQYCPEGNCYYDYAKNVKSYFSFTGGKIYLNANFIYNYMGVMIFDLSDIFKNPCKVVYRTVSLSDPFPGHNGESREPGSNWNSTSISNFILNNRGASANDVYNLKPMYKITLTPALIQQVRTYNASVADGYNDNSLVNCDGSGNNCQSTFIRNKYKSSFSGCALDGTC